MKYDGFNDWQDIMKQFEDSEPEPDEVLMAYYGSSYGYDGVARVIYRRGDKYYVATGGHCSCYGLEGQWSPCEYESKESLVACLEKEKIYDKEEKELVDSVIGKLKAS